jgi:hypothetical protein
MKCGTTFGSVLSPELISRVIDSRSLRRWIAAQISRQRSTASIERSVIMDAHRADNPSDWRQVAIRMQCTRHRQSGGSGERFRSWHSGEGDRREIFDTFYTTRPDGTGLD